jgi:hypothetical protein
VFGSRAGGGDFGRGVGELDWEAGVREVSVGECLPGLRLFLLRGPVETLGDACKGVGRPMLSRRVKDERRRCLLPGAAADVSIEGEVADTRIVVLAAGCGRSVRGGRGRGRGRSGGEGRAPREFQTPPSRRD